MKQLVKIVIGVMMAGLAWSVTAQSKIDERMDQDIEVAENILSTLFRQQSSARKSYNYFPVDINGGYLPGYGVTFRMPITGAFAAMSWGGSEPVVPGVAVYEFKSDEERRAPRKSQMAVTPKASIDKSNRDSLYQVASKKFVDVSKNFLADYGDVLSQLKADERIVVTNRSEEFGEYRVWNLGEKSRSLISVEAKREDVNQLRQGKISRDAFMAKLKIVNNEAADALDPDLEVLSSMFDRLYREDLSQTYYASGDVNYERLKDYGVIYYMRVYSSSDDNSGHIRMPTQRKEDLSKEERDKIVKELYPRFEKELVENIVEYGRTLRSLKDNEQLVFNVRLTKCTGCGIPAGVEVAIPVPALKDYSAGKATKEATIAKATVKKSGTQ